jgi:hypothetical protein
MIAVVQLLLRKVRESSRTRPAVLSSPESSPLPATSVGMSIKHTIPCVVNPTNAFMPVELVVVKVRLYVADTRVYVVILVSTGTDLY